ARDAAGRNRDDDRLDVNAGCALRPIDGLADRRLRFDQIDHGAGFHAARLGVTEAEHLDRVAAPAQHFLRRARGEPTDQAGDLAGADVERAHDRRPLRRHRLHLGGEAVLEGAHALPPLRLAVLSLSASSRACAASSERWTLTRSGKRRSIAVMSRLIRCLSRSNSARVSSARGTSASGRRTSRPFLSLRFQRRSATSTDARTWSRIDGCASRSARNAWARVAAPAPTTSGRCAKCQSAARGPTTVPSAEITDTL